MYAMKDEREAFIETIYAEYAPKLERMCLNYIHYQAEYRDMVDESIQKTFLRAFEEYDKLARMIIERKKNGKDFNFFHFMIDMEGGPCVYKRLSGCGSGTEYLAVTPWGDFYPCHQFVGMEEFLMGNVDDGIVRPDIMQEFKDCNVYAKEKCKNCFAKFYCSGGCAANAYNFGNSIYDAYDIGCELQRKRIECAIMIKAAMAAGEENEV